jgi:hypothetical protein
MSEAEELHFATREKPLLNAYENDDTDNKREDSSLR